MGMVFSVR